LIIEAPPEYLNRLHSQVEDGKLTVRLRGSWLQELEDALATCMNRPHIVYHLKVRKLTSLEVHHSRTGTLRISGQVEQQSVVLDGVGSYLALGLGSQRTHVRLYGAGLARVLASEQLDASLRGVGVLEYSGHPAVNPRISGPGRVVHIDSALIGSHL